VFSAQPAGDFRASAACLTILFLRLAEKKESRPFRKQNEFSCDNLNKWEAIATIAR
jgi:hypothetical protein